MGLFGGTSTAAIDDRWNDPALGLTVADFARWPGRDKPNRAKLIPKIENALSTGDVELPVRVIGKCSAYGPKNGHPAYPQAIHDFVDFVVSGSGKPILTTFHKSAEAIRDIDVDETLLENVATYHGGYLDLQFISADGACGRIGFLFSHGGEQVAEISVQMVGAALKLASLE